MNAHPDPPTNLDTVIRTMTATSNLFTAGFFVVLLFMALTPMQTWGVEYSQIEVIQPEEGEEELIAIHRTTSPSWGVVPISRQSELLTKNAAGVFRQWCLTLTATSATSLTNPVILSGLDEYVSERCARMMKERLQGQEVWMLVVYSRLLPLGFTKQKEFLIGPFRVQDGVLRVARVSLTDEAP